MDRKFLPAGDISDRLISNNEEKYPSRKSENDQLRDYLGKNDNMSRLRDYWSCDEDEFHGRLAGAWASDCRTDPLNCGICKLKLALMDMNSNGTILQKHGFAKGMEF